MRAYPSGARMVIAGVIPVQHLEREWQAIYRIRLEAVREVISIRPMKGTLLFQTGKPAVRWNLDGCKMNF